MMQVDLAELVEVLELGGVLGCAHDPRIDHDHLAVRRGELEGGLAVPLQLDLALGLAPRWRRHRHAATIGPRSRKIIVLLPCEIADPSMVFQGERCRFSVSRLSPTMRRNMKGDRRADEHQGQGLYRRHLRASDAARQGHLAGADPCRVRQGRAGGCGPHQGRRRRLFLRRRRAGPRADVDGRVHGAEAAPRRFDRHRRLVLRAACRPRRRGDRRRQVQGGADHPGRPAARRGHGDRHRAALAAAARRRRTSRSSSPTVRRS